MTDLAGALTECCAAAFESVGVDGHWGVVRRCDRADLADFQCNGAMGAAKSANRKPRELADAVAAKLTDHALIAEIDVAGPGFLNIRVAAKALAERTHAIHASERCGAEPAADAEHIVIDYGGPNVAKPMHVGHLRSAVIGDSLQRLLRFLGDDVISDTHLGDWGLQMGHLLTELEDEQPDLVYFDADASGPFPADSPVTIEDLARLYPAASTKARADSARNERSQHAVAELQAGRAGYRALLRHFITVSVEALKVDYDFLNVSFDLWKGESDVEALVPEVIEIFRQQELAVEDDGALIVRLAREDEKKEMPPLMLVNSRGGTGYHATDLATVVDRLRNLNPPPTRMLYVVDQRQALHFAQVFRAVDIADVFAEQQMEHIGFGTVNGVDGKPFKTREGGILRLADLNAMALSEAERRLKDAKLPADMDAAEQADVAQCVAVAALRFADLVNVRTTNYVFDLERFTSFEGKTGPYLLYAAVRIKSLLRRASAAGDTPGDIHIESATERALVLNLDGFDTVCRVARRKRTPHVIAEHVFTLAQSFSAFYSAHPIATDADKDVRASRLALSETVLRQLECGLGILGIRVPARMLIS